MNRLAISGVIAGLAVLRYTPAGIPVLELVIEHQSEQTEAGMARRVNCAVNAVIMGNLAEQSTTLTNGTAIKATGFLAKRSMKSTQLVLHIDTLEII